MADILTHEIAYAGVASIDKRAKCQVALYGYGALGSHVGELLVRQGYRQLLFLDYDRVELANLGTQLFTREDVGRPKSAQGAFNIYRKFGVHVHHENKKLTEGNAKSLSRGHDLILDLFDNIESRLAVQSAVRQLKTQCLHVGMSSDGFAQITWDESYRLPAVATPQADDAPCDYPLSANLVWLTSGFIAEIVNLFVDQGIKHNVEFTIGDMRIERRKV
jgi:molybdopterin/thiamine biosynthesis adenylyltransferase